MSDWTHITVQMSSREADSLEAQKQNKCEQCLFSDTLCNLRLQLFVQALMLRHWIQNSLIETCWICMQRPVRQSVSVRQSYIISKTNSRQPCESMDRIQKSLLWKSLRDNVILLFEPISARMHTMGIITSYNTVQHNAAFTVNALKSEGTICRTKWHKLAYMMRLTQQTNSIFLQPLINLQHLM